jgi:hypothetical protein
LASLLDPNAIPIAVFTSDAVCSWLAAQIGEPVTAGSVITLLKRMYGLSLCDFNGAHLRLHALVQHAIRDQLTDQRRTSTAVAAADALAEIWPDPETDQITGAILRTNVLTLLDRAKSALLADRAHSVLFKTAYSFRKHDRTTASYEYQQALVADCVARFGADHLDTLHARRELLNATKYQRQRHCRRRGLHRTGRCLSCPLGRGRPRHPRGGSQSRLLDRRDRQPH